VNIMGQEYEVELPGSQGSGQNQSILFNRNISLWPALRCGEEAFLLEHLYIRVAGQSASQRRSFSVRFASTCTNPEPLLRPLSPRGCWQTALNKLCSRSGPIILSAVTRDWMFPHRVHNRIHTKVNKRHHPSDIPPPGVAHMVILLFAWHHGARILELGKRGRSHGVLDQLVVRHPHTLAAIFKLASMLKPLNRNNEVISEAKCTGMGL
jgi:hypothetical protein